MKTFDDTFPAGRREEPFSPRIRDPLRILDGPGGHRTIVERLEVPLTKFVGGYIRDRHAAEDLVQETFLRVFRNLHRYRGQASLKSWVFSIARNLCLDTLRASARSRRRMIRTLAATGHDPDAAREALPRSLCPDSGRLAELEESRGLLGRALTGLPPEAKDLLVFRIYLGLSYREIARRCRVPVAGVGTRISRALRSLSAKLP